MSQIATLDTVKHNELGSILKDTFKLIVRILVNHRKIMGVILQKREVFKAHYLHNAGLEIIFFKPGVTDPPLP